MNNLCAIGAAARRGHASPRASPPPTTRRSPPSSTSSLMSALRGVRLLARRSRRGLQRLHDPALQPGGAVPSGTVRRPRPGRPVGARPGARAAAPAAGRTLAARTAATSAAAPAAGPGAAMAEPASTPSCSTSTTPSSTPARVPCRDRHVVVRLAAAPRRGAARGRRRALDARTRAGTSAPIPAARLTFSGQRRLRAQTCTRRSAARRVDEALPGWERAYERPSAPRGRRAPDAAPLLDALDAAGLPYGDRDEHRDRRLPAGQARRRGAERPGGRSSARGRRFGRGKPDPRCSAWPAELLGSDPSRAALRRRRGGRRRTGCPGRRSARDLARPARDRAVAGRRRQWPGPWRTYQVCSTELPPRSPGAPRGDRLGRARRPMIWAPG